METVNAERPLVIEDDQDIQGIIESALDEAGFEPAIAASGEEAVTLLKGGESIPVAEIEALALDMRDRPFRTVLTILTGQERLSPCPACGDVSKTLVALDRSGQCYGCGKVKLEKLYDTIFANAAMAKVKG